MWGYLGCKIASIIESQQGRYMCFKKSVLLIFLFPSPLWAAALAVDEQSVSAMGNAFAGAGAAGDDASIGFYNPAGLMLIEEAQIVGALTYSQVDAILTIESADDSFGNTIHGVSGDQVSAIPDSLIPAIHVAVPLNENFVLGANLTSPFWIQTDYADSAARYTGRQSDLIAYNGNLSLATQVSEKLSLGVGANVQYFTTKLNLTVGANNGQEAFDMLLVEYKGDDVAFYPNVGLLYEFTEHTRVGLSYRFHVEQNTQGHLEFHQLVDNPPILSIPNLDASMGITLPSATSLSAFHQLTEKIELLGDVTFVDWSSLEELVITSSPMVGDEDLGVDVPLNLQNTWRVSLGANYQYNPAVKLRTGVAYDTSSVTDDDRLIQTPDGQRFEISAGVSLAPKSWEKTRLDFAYMHSFFSSLPVDQVNLISHLIPTPMPISSELHGHFDTSAGFWGAQIVRLL
jgi:long-chain fatty acid transport protein